MDQESTPFWMEGQKLRSYISQRYVDLESWARHRFPQLGEVAYRWSGQILEPVDSLGFI